MAVPNLDEVRKFALQLHLANRYWHGEFMGWDAEYNPESPLPPLDSKMSFTPANFSMGESGIWFFSLMWERGREAASSEFLDDRNLEQIEMAHLPA
ncbi:MAG: hypothetical protein HY328_09725 [Chloroflexi bacterium]|nr:hypothetical protein [Chloroflexota bacterium]